MQRFWLDQEREGGAPSHVAEGIQFSDGSCVVRWLSGPVGLAMHKTKGDVEKAIAADGKTKIVMQDAA